MHPAASVIVFTTFSGIGFGLMTLLGLRFGVENPWFQWTATIAAYFFAGLGLLSSTLHLRRPDRAWRAFSQWRSSWLSREGVMSILTLGVFGLYSIGVLFLDVYDPWLGAIAAIMALVTVLTTSMIYAQLRTVPRWSTGWTPLAFYGFAIAGSLLLLAALLATFGAPHARQVEQYAMAAIIIAWAIKYGWWRHAETATLSARGSGTGDATGLGRIGSVRPFEPPNTSPNYLMKEMIYRVGRQRARALRRMALFLGAVAPVILIALATYAGAAAPLLILAFLLHLAGMLAERWLFFAEAEHAVGSFYRATDPMAA
ncbi:MAG: dimethyl sulfoxide reductase anchor subunit [Hyphomicrobiaceae bacterium]|nr:dimethyl sulfoxide reductase anchor subunit [Hyphomicrobiaceae bacterium]